MSQKLATKDLPVPLGSPGTVTPTQKAGEVERPD